MLASLAAFAFGFAFAAPSLGADDVFEPQTISQKIHRSVGQFDQVALGKHYALGIHRFDLDNHTEILGWQIGDSWYFGRQDGLDSGLTLVWHKQENQVSISKDGLRLTRRF
ncbi:MAG: hypothetical protein GXP16_09275 [Gammaproteobacteria bacterium]|nr:hypothetical protein [Gammaproteobacteria bacterium]